MRVRSLERLLDAARSLPGEKMPLPIATPELWPAPSAGAELADVAPLRKRIGDLMRELGGRLEPALAGALARAEGAWDQVDDLSVIDAGLKDVIARLEDDWRWAGATGQAAAALEALLLIDAAVGIVKLLERRLATLVRLRRRSGTEELFTDGRPFLDVAAALTEIARGWS